MDAAHIHLILIHFPIEGLMFSISLLVIAWWRRSDILAPTAFITAILTGLITISTYLTGESAEEVIEHLSGVLERIVNFHEETGEKAVSPQNLCIYRILPAAGGLVGHIFGWDRLQRLSPR